MINNNKKLAKSPILRNGDGNKPNQAPFALSFCLFSVGILA